MKRFLLVMIFLITSISICFGADYLHNSNAGSIPVYGFMGEYWILSVNAINHGGGPVGMYFDLLEDDVTYNANIAFTDGIVTGGFNLGRLIAYWTFIVDLRNNTSWTLCIHPAPLKLTDGSSQTEVNYYLALNIDEGDDSIDLIARSGMDNTFSRNERVSSVNRQIRFMLDYYDQDTRYSWPDGDYSATVTRTLEKN